MFKKILIANRGEIAVRVMRACREMGIQTVAVYSDADRTSLHVRYADEAVHIGPSPSTESYLRIDRIIEAAERSRAEAIHPGYGFLAENPDLARACTKAGIVFVGPTAEAMELMGSKTASRHAAIAAKLPVVPGVDRNLESFDEVKRLAEKIGFTVMLKAAAGGGGKGLRKVESGTELESAYRTARSEAQNAFNDPSVYLEKYIEQPRHVEIQVLGDHHGNLIYLGRKKDVIVTAEGLNVYPEDVEKVLREQPAIQEAAVVGKNVSLEGGTGGAQRRYFELVRGEQGGAGLGSILPRRDFSYAPHEKRDARRLLYRVRVAI